MGRLYYKRSDRDTGHYMREITNKLKTDYTQPKCHRALRVKAMNEKNVKEWIGKRNG